MTEAEWLACSDPQAMLEYLRGKASDRKLRLFAVACCRRVWPHVEDERGSKAIEVAERYADGNATEAELLQAHNSFHAWVHMLGEARSWWGQSAFEFMAKKVFPLDDGWDDLSPTLYDLAVIAAASRRVVKGAKGVVREIVRVPQESSRDGEPTRVEEACGVIREIFGNPFRPLSFDPAWLTWHVGLLLSMAQRMYGSRDFADMPVLADGLEEAGCRDQDILSHCRSGGEHVRGCWVVDLLLGKS